MVASVPSSVFKRDYDRADMRDAIDSALEGLKAAAVAEARQIGPDGFTPVGGTRNYVSQDSLDAWGKANGLGAGEQAMFSQIVRTWSGRVARGAVDEKLQRVELTASTLKTLRNTLREFFETKNKAPMSTYSGAEIKKAGDTVKRIAHQFDNLLEYDYSAKGTDTPREYAKLVDKLMNDFYGLQKGRTWGRNVSLSAIQATIKEENIGSKKADALMKALKYVSRVFSWGRTNSAYICIDQRVEVQRTLMKLFGGDSPTKKAIEKAYG